jgi:hypothetical protein
MSEHFDKRRSDIEDLFARHYIPREHEINSHILEVQAEIDESPKRLEQMIANARADEKRHLAVLREKLKGHERELVALAEEREPHERELASLRAYLETVDQDAAEQALGREREDNS